MGLRAGCPTPWDRLLSAGACLLCLRSNVQANCRHSSLHAIAAGLLAFEANCNSPVPGRKRGGGANGPAALSPLFLLHASQFARPDRGKTAFLRMDRWL